MHLGWGRVDDVVVAVAVAAAAAAVVVVVVVVDMDVVNAVMTMVWQRYWKRMKKVGRE